jgi:hypothetical protein
MCKRHVRSKHVRAIYKLKGKNNNELKHDWVPKKIILFYIHYIPSFKHVIQT